MCDRDAAERRTIKRTSAPAAAALERSMPICSTTSVVASWMPAVSSSVTGTPCTATDASTMSRVVPGLAVTMARSLRLHAFSKLDLPTLGRPTMAIWRGLCESLWFEESGSDSPARQR